MKTVLVAGGAGFIGSHLCEFLLEKEHKVLCLDNFVTGSKENIKHLNENENFELIEQDLTNSLELKQKIDQIYHLASPASPVDYQEMPLETMLANSFGTKNLLDYAKKNQTKFVFASTSEVYGDPKEHPQKETYWGNVNPVGLRACYDESKRFAEALIMVYRRKFRTDAMIARIFNTYGPRMRTNDGRIVPNFATQALKNKDITVYGDGSQTRSFCYVSDLVQGLYSLMHSGVHSPVNLGNPEELSILDFAKKIKELTKSESNIVFKDLPEDDPLKRKPDISKAKEKLEWEPKISIEDGLPKTIEWFKTQVTDS